jgi:helicase
MILKLPKKSKDDVVNIVLDTISMKKQALVFVASKISAESTAELIAKHLQSSSELEELSEKILHVLPKSTSQCEKLAKYIKHGVAFHHSGLVAEQRELIEDSFRTNLVKIICCTPTLAYGLDLPAFRTVIKTMKRFGNHGMQYIPVLEYQQMAGRSGRPKYDSYGEAIIISNPEDKEYLIENYIQGESENIYSKLAVEPVLRTYVLSLIASNFVSTKENLLEFFKKTFWAYQFEDMGKIEYLLDSVLGLLEGFGFIEMKGEGIFYSADEEISFKATELGQRVAQLYIDPLTADKLIKAMNIADEKETTDFSYLQLISATLELRPLFRTGKKDYEDIQEKFLSEEQNLVDEIPNSYDYEYDDFLNSVKTANVFERWINETDEETLFAKYSVRPGELKAKLNYADWLFYCIEELSKILSLKKVLKESTRLRIRLEYGVKEELLALLAVKHIGRIRARILYTNGIKTLSDLRKSDIAKLEKLIGKQTALKVKSQFEGKEEKTELNLNDY